MAKEAGERNDFGVLAIVFGILGIVFGIGILFGFVAGLVFSILSLIFGLVQRKRANNRWATWAIILGLIGIIINVFVIVKVSILLVEVFRQMQELQNNPDALKQLLTSQTG